MKMNYRFLTFLAASVSLCAILVPPQAYSGGAFAYADVLPDPGDIVQTLAGPYLWRNVTVVAGGFISGIQFHPSVPGLAYIRTDIGGAYRWDASGRRWISLTNFLSEQDGNLRGIESIALDPEHPDRIYLAAGTYTQSWAGNGAILSSDDRGATFRRTDMPFKMGGNENGRSMGERLAVDPNDGDVLFFGSRHDGLWRSEDRSATWQRVSSFPCPASGDGYGISCVAFPPEGAVGQPSHTVYACDNDSATPLYRSDDGGSSWNPVLGQPTNLMIAQARFAKDGVLYLTYANGPGPNGITDGSVWKFGPLTGAWRDISPMRAGQNSRFGYAGLAVDGRDSHIVMVSTIDRWNGGDDIFRSTDGGRTWNSTSEHSARDSSLSPYLDWGGSTAPLGWWIGALAIDPYNTAHVLYGTGATVWASNDADAVDAGNTSHWHVGAAGIEETAVNALISPPVGPHLISGMGDIGGFIHDDLSESPVVGWMTEPKMTGVNSLDFAALKPEIIVRVGGGGAYHGALSTDGGATWTGFGGDNLGIKKAGDVALSADGKSMVWSPNGVVSFSTDGGQTWGSSTGIPNGLSVRSDRMDPGHYYAADTRSGAVYVSTDGGRTFNGGAQILPQYGVDLRPASGEGGDVWAACGGNGLYRSKDAAHSFVRLGNVNDCETVGFGKAAPGSSYPAVYIVGKVDGIYGVYSSDDSGRTWLRINDDRHQYGWIGKEIIGDPRVFGRVYIATNGSGIIYAEPATARVR